MFLQTKNVCGYSSFPNLTLLLAHPTIVMGVPVAEEASTRWVSLTFGNFHLMYSDSLIQLLPAPVSTNASMFSFEIVVGISALSFPPITISSMEHFVGVFSASHS